MDKAEVNEIFNRFSNIRALVIGDAMVDTYLWGKVDRLSPEAPVPIVSVTTRENRLGGAANVSRNIQELGATPKLFAVVGDDDNGKEFLNLLDKRKVSAEGIFIDPSRNTTVKNRVISAGKQIVRIDEESIEYISEEMENRLIDAIKTELETQQVDVIVFVDYNKGVVTPNLFKTINDLAQEKGIPTSVDPKKQNFTNYKNVSLFKPNFKEFVEGTSFPLKKGDLAGLKKAAETFKTGQQLKLILITLSELGIFIINGDEEQYYPVAIRDIADVSGAGDTVIAVASLAMAAGLSPKIIAQMSNLAGGLVCEKVGVVPVDQTQLKKEMKSQKI
ncbi:rfaE bifunctional protein, domain I [Draconibacterium orientale]|uniref:Carbohydrate kinase n=1 Tax=Draconibacterium orientale TaxID=1168034 RepID=X5DFE7_9BACT|nr:bifunctional ADP-heptose synthase [Draconibacterium orientale]AHW59759.1 carbohydrate kinase [Draconibacterium orientale]SET15707.1 rfaE bifunctional protein, domain I [Draconibacterium orientale]